MRFLVILLAVIAVLFSTLGLIVNEQFLLAILVDVGIVLLASFLVVTLTNNKRKKLAKAEGALDVVKCLHIEGLGIGENKQCDVLSFSDKIEIREPRTNRTFQIPIGRIRALEVKSEQEFKDLDRSVVGRALVGTLLVPGIGTIVGGMSGLKSKKKGKMKTYLIINYLDKDEELKGITFENSFNFIRVRSFANGVNKSTSGTSGSQTVEL